MKKKTNNYYIEKNIYIVKALAILSVISAHSNKIIMSNNNHIESYFSKTLNQYGVVGVALFFVLSGYLFFFDTKPFSLFIKRKIFRIIIPWICTGTLVYLYIIIRKGSFNLKSYIFFLIGNGSYLYYLSLLILFYLFFFFLRKNTLLLFITIIISIINIIVLEEFHVNNIINPYLNPLNFVYYFIIGLLVARYNLYSKLLEFCSKYRYFFIVLYIGLVVFFTIGNINLVYWRPVIIPMQLLAMLFILSISSFKILRNDLFIDFGKESFSIYLLHMPIAGVVVYLLNIMNLWVILLLRPIIILFITYSLIKIYKKICDLVSNEGSNKLKNLIGTK